MELGELYLNLRDVSDKETRCKIIGASLSDRDINAILEVTGHTDQKPKRGKGGGTGLVSAQSNLHHSLLHGARSTVET